MVEYSSAPTKVFEALSDPNRLAIVESLLDGEKALSQLANPSHISLTATLKHLKILEEAGLAISEKRGRVRFCRFNPAPLQEMSEWANSVTHLWSKRLDSLDRFLTRKHGGLS